MLERVFTDCQLWDATGYGVDTVAPRWRKYLAGSPASRLYLFDLAGYGNTPVLVHPKENAYLVSGWSDKIFDMLAALEDGQTNVQAIQRIEL